MGISESERLTKALVAFDAANAGDPVREVDSSGTSWPRAVLYGRRMSRTLLSRIDEPSEALQLAARCQHLLRWRYPRSDHPEGRSGYLSWRRDCAQAHRRDAGRILEDCGYDENTVQRVGSLLLKEGLPEDSEAQALEDTACLVFLEYHLQEFGPRVEAGKLERILRRTWAKMSVNARRDALQLEFDSQVQDWLEAADLK